MDEKIIEGMARIMWASAWHQHVEEARCQNVSGLEITDVMPDVPEVALRMAYRWAGRIEGESGSLILLLYAAAKTDGLVVDVTKGIAVITEGWPDNVDNKYAEEFGNSLAWMAMGAGPSWFDDHKEFDLKVPHLGDGCEAIDLQDLAKETCELCGYRPPPTELDKLLDEVGKVYMEVTGGRISIPRTKAEEIIAVHQDYVEEKIERALETQRRLAQGEE